MTKRNLTTTYLLPAILNTHGIPLKKLEDFGFINAYLLDVNYERTFDSCLHLLFKVDLPILFGEFIEKYTNEIIEEYDPYPGYTVLVFAFPVKYIHNYQKFLEGKYSLFTDDYKSLFPKTPTIQERQKGMTTTKEHLVFKKDEKLRKSLEELWCIEIPFGSELASIHGETDILDMNI